MLKTHAIELTTRMKPNRSGYYQMMWEEKDLGTVLATKIENCFLNEESQIEINYGDYLRSLFKQVNH